MPSFILENRFDGLVSGTDEAGRGPLAGPVVAAAVVFLKQDLKFIYDLDDSKKLSRTKREILFHKITSNSDVICDYAIISNDIIDKINIFNATKRAMLEAVTKISKKIDIYHVLVDGNHKMLDSKFEETPVVKGDSKSSSIAAASIIAKVVRDRIMLELDRDFPYYNWKKNSGYGTKEHVQSIFKNGISKYHRKSFSPIKDHCMELKGGSSL